MHQILTFNGWVAAYCAGIPSRVHVALEKRRHMDPPSEPPKKAEPVGMTYHITGPTQINNHSPGSTQNSGQREPGRERKTSKAFPWVRLLVSVVLGSGGVVGLVAKFRHNAPPPTTAVAPTVTGTSAPSAPSPSDPNSSRPVAPLLPAPMKAKPASGSRKRPNHAPESTAPLENSHTDTPDMTINGPTQINNNSPGSVQNNGIGPLAR